MNEDATHRTPLWLVWDKGIAKRIILSVINIVFWSEFAYTQPANWIRLHNARRIIYVDVTSSLPPPLFGSSPVPEKTFNYCRP